jgi:hypothetical protein
VLSAGFTGGINLALALAVVETQSSGQMDMEQINTTGSRIIGGEN